MLLLLRSLFVSKSSAAKAWNRGEPRAASPQEANRAWAPYVRHWTRMCNAEYFEQTRGRRSAWWSRGNAKAFDEGTLGEGALGWLRDASFWASYWATFENQRVSDDMLEAIGLIVFEGAFTQNMALFESTHGAKARQFVAKYMWTGMGSGGLQKFLHHGCVVDWYLAQDPASAAAMERSQRNAWSSMSWECTRQATPLFTGRDEPSMEQTVRLVVDGFSRWNLSPEQKVRALGHLFCNCPAQWFHPGTQGGPIVRQLQERLDKSLLADMDIEAVALCSGFGSNATETLRGIKVLGRRLVRGKMDPQNIQPNAPDLKMLISLYDLTSPMALYHAVVASGMHRLGAAAPTQFELPALD